MNTLRLLATAIAGQAVEVAPAAPGEPGWTDGRTIYLDVSIPRRGQLVQLAVQASLLAAGSFDADVVAALRRDRALGRPYLAIEGHRALAANEELLPPWMKSVIDHATAARARTPGEALGLARREPSLVAPPVFGTVDARRWHGPAREEMASMRGPAPEPAGPAELDDDPGRPDLGPVLSSPIGVGGPIGGLLARLLRPGRSRNGDGPPHPGASGRVGRGRPALGRTLVAGFAPPTGITAWAPRAGMVHHYPEWDLHLGAYRPDWCRVLEQVADTGTGSPPEAPDCSALRSALARLGTGLTRCRRRPQGDDLDLDAMVDAHVVRRVGGAHSGDVYIESLRRRRDLSVLLLLDASGSAAEPGVAGRSVHEHQREAAGLLLAALHGLGDRVALYAFNSQGRSAVRVSRVKAFDERCNEDVWRRLGALRPGGYTRLGAAIRHASALLERGAGTPRRLLVVLSDGFAYDHGYEGPYGEADARRALLEARRRGLGCLCLSIGAESDVAALRRVFGPTAHAALPSAQSLPGLVGPLFRAALASAEVQWRRAQRRERHRVEERST